MMLTTYEINEGTEGRRWWDSAFVSDLCRPVVAMYQHRRSPSTPMSVDGSVRAGGPRKGAAGACSRNLGDPRGERAAQVLAARDNLDANRAWQEPQCTSSWSRVGREFTSAIVRHPFHGRVQRAVEPTRREA